MPINLLARYGYQTVVQDPSQYEEKIRRLVDELCDEEFGRPDYEHSAVSVSHSSQWYIEATMNGVVIFGQLDSKTPDRYLYGLSKERLIEVFLLLARGQLEEVRSLHWSDTLDSVRGSGDHYLYWDRVDMNDLHRAASKGDCDWIEKELQRGADLRATDQDGATPLHQAALAGHVEACQLLLAKGADPHAEDEYGETPVEYAQLARECVGPEVVAKLVKTLSKT